MPHPNPTEKDYRHVDQARLHRNALRLRSDDVHRQPLIQRLSSEAKGCHGSPSSFPESGCAGVPAEPGIPALRGFVTGLSTLRNRSGVRGVNDPGCVVQVGSAFGRVVSADPRPASLLQVLQLLIHLPVILRPPRAAVFFAGAAIVAGVSSRSGCIPPGGLLRRSWVRPAGAAHENHEAPFSISRCCGTRGSGESIPYRSPRLTSPRNDRKGQSPCGPSPPTPKCASASK